MERVAIVGSRKFPQLKAVEAFVDGLPAGTVVISGGAIGVDLTAEVAAKTRGLDVVSFPADWKRHGRRAGFIRNQLIVDAADIIVAFWDGKSKGTSHTVSLAKKAKKPVLVVGPLTDAADAIEAFKHEPLT